MKTSSHRNRHASCFLSSLAIAALVGFSACAKNTHVIYKVVCKLIMHVLRFEVGRMQHEMPVSDTCSAV